MPKAEPNPPHNSKSQAQINAEFAEITGIVCNLTKSEDTLHTQLYHSQAGPRDYVLAQTPDFDFIDGPLELQDPFAKATATPNPLSRQKLKYRWVKLVGFFCALIPVGLFWMAYDLTDLQNQLNISPLLPAIALSLCCAWYFGLLFCLLRERKKLKETEVKYAFLLETEKTYSTSALEFDDGARL